MKRGRELAPSRLPTIKVGGALPKGVCVKVKHLRPRHDNLREWLGSETHHLATRHGRVFIGSGDSKHVFHYAGSEWANPFTVKEHGLEKSLELYKQHLSQLLEKEEVSIRFMQLSKMTEIGCFCDPSAKCHRDVILAKLEELTSLKEDKHAAPDTKKTKRKQEPLKVGDKHDKAVFLEQSQ